MSSACPSGCQSSLLARILRGSCHGFPSLSCRARCFRYLPCSCGSCLPAAGTPVRAFFCRLVPMDDFAGTGFHEVASIKKEKPTCPETHGFHFRGSPRKSFSYLHRWILYGDHIIWSCGCLYPSQPRDPLPSTHMEYSVYDRIPCEIAIGFLPVVPR